MQVRHLMVIGIFSLAVSSAQALAQGADLVGTWVGKVEARVVGPDENIRKGVREEASVVIEEVDGRFVRAYKTWKAKNESEAGYIEDVEAVQAKEPMLGVISADGKTIDFVELEDEGTMFCDLTGPDTMEIIYLEGVPHPTVATYSLHREK